MKTNAASCALLLAVGTMAMAGCQRQGEQRAERTAVPPIAMAPVPHALPTLVVSKNPTCGCCGLWVDAMRRAGFQVEVHDLDNLDPIKTGLGIPPGKGSCHTAEVGGYFIEGHVPADDIKRLLAQKPKAKGLVLPGMPLGAPGMETPDGSTQSYTVELVRADGSTEPFARHGQQSRGR